MPSRIDKFLIVDALEYSTRSCKSDRVSLVLPCDSAPGCSPNHGNEQPIARVERMINRVCSELVEIAVVVFQRQSRRLVIVQVLRSYCTAPAPRSTQAPSLNLFSSWPPSSCHASHPELIYLVDSSRFIITDDSTSYSRSSTPRLSESASRVYCLSCTTGCRSLDIPLHWARLS